MTTEPTLTALFQQGLAAHQKGELAQAQTAYEAVLAANPQHFDALHLLGVIAAQTEQPSRAVALISQAIEINAQDAGAQANLGQALMALQRYDAAEASFDRALALQPDNAQTYLQRGLARYRQQRLHHALTDYDHALVLQPASAEAHYLRGNTLKALQRLQEAIASYDQALSRAPDHVQAHINRANTLNLLRCWSDALTGYDQALRLQPGHALAQVNRGTVLQQLGHLDEAEASYRQALALQSDLAQAHYNLGVVLRLRHRLQESIACNTRAIELQPRYFEAYSNRGIALQELGQSDAALADYNRALALRPDYAEANFNKALVLLAQGDYENGWPLYEWRWAMPTFTSPRRNFAQTLWLGQTGLQGQTILLHAEQGLGDSIQFGRYVQQVCALGAQVLLEVPKSLVGLFSDARLANVRILQKGEVLPHFDLHCPLMSLPLAFQARLNTLPAPPAYLFSRADKRQAWRAQLGEGTQPRIGLVWQGNTKHQNDHNRSLPLHVLLESLPQGPQYVCLQKDIHPADQALLEQHAVVFFPGALQDFTDTAALCDVMDRVISIDTSVAHLSAALGKPTSILLPFVADWRWLLNRCDSPWYPSVTLYRQTHDANWQSVLQQLARSLHTL